MPESSLRDGELLAALDLGSNSFHMVVGRYLLGQVRIVDRLRETVRMGAGLDEQGNLSAEALQRALDALARMGERIASLPQNRVRAVATNTVRQLRNPRAFLLPAETALGHAIEVVSGREEARLIYLGVARGLPPRSTRRLVMDIGGGSTESIIGEGFQPLERESLQMGCIATTRRFFGDGRLSARRWREGFTEVSAEFQQFAATYRARGWQEVIGSSGTIKAVGKILSALRLTRGAITDQGLEALRDRLLRFDTIADVDLPGLSDERRPVLPGGLLVLSAAFEALGLTRMVVAQTAMREGVLYDMLGRVQHSDPRDGSVLALATRYAVDVAQAERVETTALALFDQVQAAWELEDGDRRMLGWAARIHELGLAIAHSQYQVHGAYVVEHSDIAGFSQQEQQVLATLLRCQRRGIPASAINALPERLARQTLRLVLLLRLAVLLHRSHGRDPLPPLSLAAGNGTLHLTVPPGWLDRHPLIRADLATEHDYLAAVGCALALGEAAPALT
jgi:exopolyphosphatase/guanosine-5'-triphosphate,3'-diphosphate pyrophosphatase